MNTLRVAWRPLRLGRTLLAATITAGLFAGVGGCWHDHDDDHDHSRGAGYRYHDRDFDRDHDHDRVIHVHEYD